MAYRFERDALTARNAMMSSGANQHIPLSKLASGYTLGNL